MLLLTIVLGCFAAKRQKQKTKRPGQTYLPTYLPTNQLMFVAAVNAFIPRCLSFLAIGVLICLFNHIKTTKKQQLNTTLSPMNMHAKQNQLIQ